MKYIVTGGCGFIGSNIVRRLIEDGNEVVVIDNLSTGSKDNVKGLNVGFYDSINRIKDISGVDGIFHLGIASSTPIYRNDRRMITEGVNDFITIMEYAKDAKVRVIYASTSSLYSGNPVPFREDMQAVPKDFYSEVRVLMERLAKVYNEFYGVESIGMRMFSVYGDNEQSKKNYANLISQILWAKESGKTYDIYNKGKTVRDFIHVDDVVDAYLIAMNSKIRYDVINIGYGKSYTINQILEFIGMKNIKYIEVPFKNYVSETGCDISKAKKLLGFRAKISVEDYIRNRLQRVRNANI